MSSSSNRSPPTSTATAAVELRATASCCRGHTNCTFLNVPKTECLGGRDDVICDVTNDCTDRVRLQWINTLQTKDVKIDRESLLRSTAATAFNPDQSAYHFGDSRQLDASLPNVQQGVDFEFLLPETLPAIPFPGHVGLAQKQKHVFGLSWWTDACSKRRLQYLGLSELEFLGRGSNCKVFKLSADNPRNTHPGAGQVIKVRTYHAQQPTLFALAQDTRRDVVKMELLRRLAAKFLVNETLIDGRTLRRQLIEFLPYMVDGHEHELEQGVLRQELAPGVSAAHVADLILQNRQQQLSLLGFHDIHDAKRCLALVVAFCEIVHAPILLYSQENRLSVAGSYTRHGEAVPVAIDINRGANINVCLSPINGRPLFVVFDS